MLNQQFNKGFANTDFMTLLTDFWMIEITFQGANPESV